jgi:hypothetical protein
VCPSEGLGLKSTITSSLVLVNDYANASIYIDLSANTEYRSYKVLRFLIKFTFLQRNVFIQISIQPYNPNTGGFGTELVDWNKEIVPRNRVSHCFASHNALLTYPVCAIDPQSRTIEITSLLPGKLFRAVIFPTTNAGRESAIPYRNSNLRSTCGCPIDEATLRQTEPTGKPSDVTLVQVWMCVGHLNSLAGFSNPLFIIESRQDLLELDRQLNLRGWLCL